MFGLPNYYTVFGCELSTYVTIIAVVITLALIIILCGGILGLMVTDCLQGLILFPCMFIMVIFICRHFSWFGEMAPVMLDRVPGESFLNPYDVSGLRDFNLFAFFVTIFTMVFQGASWMGGGSSSAAKSPHEQKMAGVLGRWAGGLFWMFAILLSIAIVTFFNHANFAPEAKNVRDAISINVIREIIPEKSLHPKFEQAINAIPAHAHIIGTDEPLSHKNNLDTPYLSTVEKVMDENGIDKVKSQEFATLFHQLMLPFTMRHLLPSGLFGLFALMMVLMMLSTDDTRIYCSGTTIAQDIILPLLKKPLTPKQHVLLIKGCVVFVGIIFFLGSCLMKQLDYINLFITIVSSIWMGGCAPVMLGGLYCRFGNTTGAFASLITGMSVSLGGFFVQRNWADMIYPWLLRHGLTESVGNVLAAISSPLNPIIVWEMDAKKCPINAVEFYAMAMLISLAAYGIGSFLTYKEPFNMDRMLHRGIYNIDQDPKPKTEWRLKTIFRNLVGITPEYSKFDRFLAWFTFYFKFMFYFFIGFVVVVIWNGFAAWPHQWWSIYFLVFILVLPGILAFLSTFLFTIGGIIDLRQLFVSLRTMHVDNPLDNGVVCGSISLADVEEVERIQKKEHEVKGKNDIDLSSKSATVMDNTNR